VFLLGMALLATTVPGFGHRAEAELHRGAPTPVVAPFPGTPAPLASRPETTLTRSIYGYAPYWADERWLRYDLLDRIGLFDVTLNPDGSITNLYGFPGRWAATIDRAHRNGVKVEMVATCFDWANIHGAIRAPNSIPNLVALAESSGVDGINLDFEGLWYGDRDTFTLFVRRLSAACRSAGLDLTLATPPLNQERAYDLPALADTTDGLFIMGYDFHWLAGPEAGPVAPLSGWTFYGNLQMAIDYYLSTLGDGSKLWLGLPLYCYQWPTYADTVRSRTTGPGEACWYSEAANRAATHGYRWDGEGKSPWYAYNSGGWRQGWFDDDTSLLMKYGKANEHDFLGAGMWALGYDGARPELWAALRETFNRPLSEFANGGFEQWRLDTLAVPSDTSPNPAGWHEGRRGRYRRETAVVRTGASSVSHRPDTLGYAQAVRSMLYQDVAVRHGERREFSGWAYKNDSRVSRCRLEVEWYDSDRALLARVASADLVADSAGWRRLTTGMVQAPQRTASARLCLVLEGRGGAVLWDDVDFGAGTWVRERTTRHASRPTPAPTIVGGSLNLTPDISNLASDIVLLDATGRRVCRLRPGPNDLTRLAPGVYFVCPTAVSSRPSAVSRIVLVRP
jgi:hypothetical protein